MSLIKCIHCGMDVSDTSDFCIHCGKSLKVNKCPDCGNIISDNDTFCNNCGRKLIKEKKGKNKKKILMFILIPIIIIFLIIVGYYSFTVEIPYLYNIEKDNAQNILFSNNLIAEFVYEYNDYIEEGNVIEVFPDSHDRVSKNSLVTVYVSKGPKTIYSSSSTLTWYSVGYEKDEWKFNSPTIVDGYLYLDCDIVFYKNFTWKGEGFGVAAINDTFDKTVPLDIEYSNSKVEYGVSQHVTLKVSVNDLEVKKPTTLYFRLIALDGDYEFNINANIAISW